MQTPDRSQFDPKPKTIDESIPADHLARLVLEMEGLDRTPLYEQNKEAAGVAPCWPKAWPI